MKIRINNDKIGAHIQNGVLSSIACDAFPRTTVAHAHGALVRADPGDRATVRACIAEVEQRLKLASRKKDRSRRRGRGGRR